jgi:endoglucanase
MKLLKKLTETPGIAGREERVRQVVIDNAKSMFDEISTDPMGNLICLKRARKGRRGSDVKKVMLACHMDEIGFYVRDVDDNGFLRIINVGGFDTRNLFARRVLIQGTRDLCGVLNPIGKPIHIASEEEKKRVPKISEFYVDLCLDAMEVKKLVNVGDPVTLIQEMIEIGEVVTGKALDNRAAIWVGLNAVKKAAARLAHDVYFVATVQEEVGVRGAYNSSFGIDPDIGIAIDTTLACDTPGIDKADAVCRMGGGVGLKIMDSMSISSRPLVDDFAEVAKKRKIPYQLEILPCGGTDQAGIQRTRAGKQTITLSIPTRYIHTVTESIKKSDLTASVDLLAAWLAKR